MADLNRRDFLALVAMSGASVCANTTPWSNHRQIKAGMAGWNDASRDVAAVFRDIPNLGVAGVTGVPSRMAPPPAEWRAYFPESQPEIFQSLAAMLKGRHFDFLYANAPDHILAKSSIHLLLEDPNPYGFLDLSNSPACVQVLPRYEFSGFSRMSAITGDWTSAIIDCRARLPREPFQNRTQFAVWLYRQVGEAVDLACELLSIRETHQVFAVATPASSPNAAQLGWRIADCDPRYRKTIDVSVTASHSQKEQAAIKLILRGACESTVLRSSPRSPRLTRVITSNLIDALSSKDPQILAYRPSTLTRSHNVVTRAAMTF